MVYLSYKKQNPDAPDKVKIINIENQYNQHSYYYEIKITSPLEFKKGVPTTFDFGIALALWGGETFFIKLHNEIAKKGIILPEGIVTVFFTNQDYISTSIISLLGDITLPADTTLFIGYIQGVDSVYGEPCEREKLNVYDREYYYDSTTKGKNQAERDAIYMEQALKDPTSAYYAPEKNDMSEEEMMAKLAKMMEEAG